MKPGKYMLLVCIGLIPFYGMAQVQPALKDTSKPVAVVPASLSPALQDSNIHVYAPASVRNADQKLYDYQRANRGTSPGFRVQIDFGQERNAVTKTKSDFSVKYSTVSSYITYKQPYFKVSVGDFRTRLEAVRFLNTVKKDYPAAFVVAERIFPPALQ